MQNAQLKFVSFYRIFTWRGLTETQQAKQIAGSFAVKPAIYLATSCSRRNAIYASCARVSVEIKHAQHDILAFIINYMAISALK